MYINCLVCYHLVHVDMDPSNKVFITKTGQDLTSLFSKFFNAQFDNFFAHFDTSFCQNCTSNVQEIGSKLTILKGLEDQIQRLKGQFENDLISGYNSSLDQNGCPKQEDPNFQHRSHLIQDLGLVQRTKIEVEVDDVIPQEPSFELPDFDQDDQENDQLIKPREDHLVQDLEIDKLIKPHAIIVLKRINLPPNQLSFKLSELENNYDVKITENWTKVTTTGTTNNITITKRGKNYRHRFPGDGFKYCTIDNGKCDKLMENHVLRVHQKVKTKYTCEICHKSLCSKFKLIVHTRRKHTGEKPYLCEVCDHSSYTVNDLRLHMKGIHKDANKYKCEICSKGCVTMSLLKAHQVDHEDRSLICHICSKVFKNQPSLNGHMKVHTERYTGSKCSQNLESKNELNSHMIRYQDNLIIKPLDIVLSTDKRSNVTTTSTTISTNEKTINKREKIYRYRFPGDGFKYCTIDDDDGKCEFRTRFDKLMENHFHRVHLKKKTKYTCDICHKSLCSKFKLIVHKRRTHTGEKPYLCEVCDHSSYTVDELRLHMKRIHKDDGNKYRCEICFKGCVTMSLLKAHQEDHEDRRLICHICAKVFKNQRSLNGHMRAHTERYICSKCGHNLKSKNGLNSHMMICQVKLILKPLDIVLSNLNLPPNQLSFKLSELKNNYGVQIAENKSKVTTTDTKKRGKNYRHRFPGDGFKYCTYNDDNDRKCEYRTRFDNLMECHVLRVHLKKKRRFNCDVCSISCESNIRLIVHKRRKHTGEKPFICEVCAYSCCTIDELRAHKEIHDNGDNMFKCDVCSKGFVIMQRLKEHEKIHLDRSQICHVCAKFFKNRVSLEVHLKSHTESYICSKCGKNLTSKNGLNSHEMICLDEYPYKCTKCPKKFVIKSRFSRHVMNIHEGIKLTNFDCNLCEKKFYYKHSLIGHTRAAHTGERPFKCTYCDKAFTKRYYANVHEKTHNQDPDKFKYQCKFCGKKFLLNHYLLRHYSRTPLCKIKYLEEKKSKDLNI